MINTQRKGDRYMTKRKQKRRIKLLSFSFFILILSVIISCTSTVLLRAYDNSLIEQKQSLESKIKVYEILNDDLYKQIDEIDTEYRMNMEQLLKQTKLKNNPDNITEIPTNND